MINNEAIAEREIASVSVLTPSYNYARFIDACIASIRHQSGNFRVEQIIQDGLSTDDTESVVNSKTANSQVRWFQEADAGQSDALNKALLHSRSELIGWLNADEFYLEGALEALVAAAEANPDAVGFFGDCALVDADGKLIRLLPGHRMSRGVLEQYGCFVSSCTTLIRREHLDKVGWDVTLRRSMDWDLWLKLSRIGKLVYVPRVVAAFRVHDAQVTNVPEAIDRDEFQRLDAAHGITRTKASRIVGRVNHIRLKLIDGAYARQLHASVTSKGRSLEWWPGADLRSDSRGRE